MAAPNVVCCEGLPASSSISLQFPQEKEWPVKLWQCDHPMSMAETFSLTYNPPQYHTLEDGCDPKGREMTTAQPAEQREQLLALSMMTAGLWNLLRKLFSPSLLYNKSKIRNAFLEWEWLCWKRQENGERRKWDRFKKCKSKNEDSIQILN